MSSCAGDWVEVRSKEEILATLDKEGRLDGMPFMPEMFSFCGQRMRVYRRSHKGCDTTQPIRSRALPNGVILEGARCSGAAHGDCQAACSIFWKEAWLKPADQKETSAPAAGSGCTEEDVTRATLDAASSEKRPKYRCQATDYPDYTLPLRTRDIGQFTEDFQARNISVPEFLMTVCYFVFDFVASPQRAKRGAPFRWLYDRIHWLWSDVPFPRRRGVLTDTSAVPLGELNLKPGEFVRVKPYKDILATLDTGTKNRGLYFDAEMVPYCGGVYRVRHVIDHFVDENTGFMRKMKTPAVILENVWCRSRYSDRRLFCPRAIYSWWREGWLERAPEAQAPSVEKALGRRTVLKTFAGEIAT